MVRDLLAVQKTARPVPSARVVDPHTAAQDAQPCSPHLRRGERMGTVPGRKPVRACVREARQGQHPHPERHRLGSLPALPLGRRLRRRRGVGALFPDRRPGLPSCRIDPVTLGVTFVATIDRSVTPAGDTGAKYMFLTVAGGRGFRRRPGPAGGAQITTLDTASGKPVHSAALPFCLWPADRAGR